MVGLIKTINKENGQETKAGRRKQNFLGDEKA
jgi:hypothetical protein